MDDNNPSTTEAGMLHAQASPTADQEYGNDNRPPATVTVDASTGVDPAMMTTPLPTTTTTTSPSGGSTPRNSNSNNSKSSGSKGKSKVRTWEQMYECLVKFKEENDGSVAVPRTYKPDKNLGEWVVKQRMFQRKLTAEQTKKLKDIGFSFESRLESYDRKWSEMFAELVKYQKENNGSCVIPDSKKGDDDGGLGKLSRWIHYQRKHYNRGNLAADRIEKLNSIGFVWQKHAKKSGGAGAGSGKKPRKEPNTTKIDEKWNVFYKKLEEFHKEHGHSKILQDHHDQQLYFWFKTQRTLMHQGLLRADRKEQLDKLDMVWDTKETLQKNWEAQFERLKEYKAQKGTINCTHRYEPNGLGNWIAYQKRTFREGTIEPERAKRLLAEDMAYIAEKDPSWNDRFAKVKLVMTWKELNPELERWTRLQLVLQDCNKQSRDRRIMLDSIRLREFAAMPGGPLWKPKPKRIPIDMLPFSQKQQGASPRKRLTTTTTTRKTKTKTAKRAASVPDTTGAKLAVLVNATIATEEPAVAGAAAAAAASAAKETTVPMDISVDADADATTTNAAAAPKPAPSPPRPTIMVEEQTTTTTTEPMIEEGVSPVATAPAAPKATGVAAILAATATPTATSPAVDDEEAATTTTTPPALPEPLEKPKRKRGRPRLYPIKVPTRRKRTWEESFQALSDYKEKHGTVKLELANCDSALVKWAKKQRTYKHSLTEEQTNRLEGIGFCFDGHIAIRENKWEERFNQLVDHVNRKGNAIVSRKENKDLNVWVGDQRKKYRAGTIRKDRLDRLNSLGFVWNTENSGTTPGSPKKGGKDPTNTPKYNATWQLYYTKLCAFHKLHGHCDVKPDQDQSLVEWAKKQRALYQNKSLSKERIDNLNLLGFVWKHKQHNDELAWNSKYDMLVLYKEREGHCDLSASADRWGLKTWSGTQKSVFKTGDMPPERARKLLTLGFPVVLEREISWNGRYKKLKEMTQEDFNNIWKDPPLERWIGLQRVLIETDSLPSERKRLMLELLGETQGGNNESSNNEDSNDDVGVMDSNMTAGTGAEGEAVAANNNDGSSRVVQEKDNAHVTANIGVSSPANNNTQQPNNNLDTMAMMI